eukprot:514363_1
MTSSETQQDSPKADDIPTSLPSIHDLLDTLESDTTLIEDDLSVYLGSMQDRIAEVTKLSSTQMRALSSVSGKMRVTADECIERAAQFVDKCEQLDTQLGCIGTLERQIKETKLRLSYLEKNIPLALGTSSQLINVKFE